MMLRWAGRYLGHCAAVLVAAVIIELCSGVFAAVLAQVFGVEIWATILGSKGFAQQAWGVLVYTLPLFPGVAAALPVFRFVSGLGWPVRLGWGALTLGATGFVAVYMIGFIAVLNAVVTRSELSILILLTMLTAGFMLVCRAQGRAAERTARAEIDAFA